MIPGISQILKRIYLTEDLPLEEAIDFTAHPTLTTPVGPFGEFLTVPPTTSSATPPTKKRKGESVSTGKGTRHIQTPVHSDQIQKFNETTLHSKSLISFRDFQKIVPPAMQTTTWYDTFLRLNSTAVAMPTWKKYCSALNKLSLYCETTNQQLQWPLSEQLLCGFTLWALRSQGLSVDTVKSYIHGLSHLQKLHGFPGVSITRSPTLPYLLTGARHGRIPRGKVPIRRPITFHRLLLLRRAILNTNWNKYNKIALWTCALVAFFGSFRLGELLCKHSKIFDATSSLLGEHLTYCQTTNTWRILIQSPKSNAPQGERIILFPIPNPKLCPVKFLTRYRKQQRKYGLYENGLPVFRFRSGRNITLRKMNIFLHKIFPPRTRVQNYGTQFPFRPNILCGKLSRHSAGHTFERMGTVEQ